MEVRETRDSDSLDVLREEWESLLERSSTATIYQTWEWNQAWWHVYGQGKRLRLLEVRKDGRLIGLAPLYTSGHFKTPLRRLAFLGTGPSDYLDVIAEDAEAECVCAVVLDHISASQHFDLADLQQLSPDSNLHRHVENAGNQKSKVENRKLIAQEPCPHLLLPSTWDELAAGLGKKTRSNLSYYDRLIERSFEKVEYELATEETLEESMAALFELHQQRWRARWLPGVLGSARTRQFHLLVARRFLERGWLRLHLLRLDGRPAAALYCFQYRSRCYYYLGGFAPELSKFSLGTVLTARAIRMAIEEGCEDFDFLRGNEPYKYRWQPEERVNARLLIANPARLRGRAMLALNRLEQRIEHKAKAFAEKQGRRKQK